MNRSIAMRELRRRADALRRMGATALYLFGSTVRDDAGQDSDVDLFIEYDPSTRFNALDLVGLKLFLEEELGTEVDITTRDSLHPLLRADIEQSAVRVY